MDYTDNKNLISIKNAIFAEGKFISLQELSVKTYKENKKKIMIFLFFLKKIFLLREFSLMLPIYRKFLIKIEIIKFFKSLKEYRN